MDQSPPPVMDIERKPRIDIHDVTDAAGNAATQVQRVVTVVNRDPDSISIDQNR